MKKTIFILIGIILSGIAFEGCQKKGENDPAISLSSRKARLTGEWVLSEGASTEILGTATIMETLSGTTKTTTAGGTTTVSTYSHKVTIEKDGTWSSVITDAGTGYSMNVTSSGTWNWLGGVGETKKRSQVNMTTLSETTMLTMGGTTTTDIDTYTGSSAPSYIWNIDQLKSKEMIIIWEGSVLTGATVNTSTGTYTFIQ